MAEEGVEVRRWAGGFLRMMAWGWGTGIGLALGCLAVNWGVAERHWRRAEAGMRGLGLPVKAEDFARPKLRDEENSAIAFLKAAAKCAATGVDSPRASNDDYDTRFLPLPKGWWARADASSKANGAALELARNAGLMKHSNFGADELFANSGAFPQYLSSIRNLANAMADDALRSHLLGDDIRYFDLFETMGDMSRKLENEPTLMVSLSGMSIDAMRISDVPMVAAGLKVGDGKGEVPRERVLRAAAELMEGEEMRERVYRGLASEGILIQGFIAPLYEHTVFTRPLKVSMVADVSEHIHLLVEKARRGEKMERVKHLELLPASIGWFSLVSYDRIPENCNRVIFMRRVAAVTFACAAYRAEHEGKWPERMEDLVGKYLPTAPVDPTSESGEGLVYRLVGGKRPVVIGVGDQLDMRSLPDEKLVAGPAYGSSKNRLIYLVDLSLFEKPVEVIPATEPAAN